MAEELQDAAYTLPRAMMYSTIANGGMGLVMMIAYCYVIGDFLTGTCRVRCDHLVQFADVSSLLHSHWLRIYQSVLQRHRKSRRRQCDVLGGDHRHRILLHDHACNYLTAAICFRSRPRCSILELVCTRLFAVLIPESYAD